MKWYVVHTFSGCEHKVRADILEAIKYEDPEMQKRLGEIIVPVEPPVPGEGKKPGGRKKFFPGYILVQADLDTRLQHFIRNRRNVTGFVGNEKGPRPLSDQEVEAIRSQMERGAVRKPEEVHFKEGMAVRIKDGPFVNFSGVVEEIKEEKRKLRVLVTIFGRATPVEVDFEQVERV